MNKKRSFKKVTPLIVMIMMLTMMVITGCGKNWRPWASEPPIETEVVENSNNTTNNYTTTTTTTTTDEDVAALEDFKARMNASDVLPYDTGGDGWDAQYAYFKIDHSASDIPSGWFVHQVELSINDSVYYTGPPTSELQTGYYTYAVDLRLGLALTIKKDGADISCTKSDYQTVSITADDVYYNNYDTDGKGKE